MQAIQAIYVSWAAGGRSFLCAIPAPLMLARAFVRRGTIAPAIIINYPGNAG